MKLWQAALGGVALVTIGALAGKGCSNGEEAKASKPWNHASHVYDVRSVYGGPKRSILFEDSGAYVEGILQNTDGKVQVWYRYTPDEWKRFRTNVAGALGINEGDLTKQKLQDEITKYVNDDKSRALFFGEPEAPVNVGNLYLWSIDASASKPADAPLGGSPTQGQGGSRRVD